LEELSALADFISGYISGEKPGMVC